MGKLAWYYNRLKAMGPMEVLLRVREHGLKMTEVKHFDRLNSVKVDDLGPVNQFPVLPSRSEVTADELAGLQQEADAILSGDWHVLRGHELKVSFPPEWHKDYLCGKVVPDSAKRIAKDLDHRSLPEDIDPRIVWETSRWIQLVRLAQLAWVKDDADIALTIIETLEDWVVENPLGYGINWTSPMEPGIRLTNFTWIHSFLTEVSLRDELTNRLEHLVAAILPGHVWWVWRYHSVGTSANNHLLGELCGLMMALARWRHGEKWSTDFNKISRIMCKELSLQFAEDGGNLEQGLHYHLFAWEMGWQGLRAMDFLDMVVPSGLSEKMGRAAYFFAAVVSPQEPWDFGDSDDAHVTPVFLREQDCLLEWQGWLSGKPEGHFISLWFGDAPYSTQGGEKYEDWTFFPTSGYAIYQKDSLMLRLDGSPLGFGSMAAHGHIDALHLSVWYEGQALIIDPGTGSYFDNREVRDYLLSPEAHNGPCIVGSEEYPVHAGPFLWTKHHQDPTWIMNSSGVGVEVKYGGITIKRGVSVDGDVIEIVDTIMGGSSETQTTWLTSPKSEVQEDGSIQRENVNLACKVYGEPIAFNKDEAKCEAGHCSEYFRSDDFAPYAQNFIDHPEAIQRQVTTFKITKKSNEH